MSKRGSRFLPRVHPGGYGACIESVPMTSRSLLPLLLLPWALLSLLACGDSPPPPENPPGEPLKPTVRSVTWDAGLPESCSKRQAVLSVTINGGTPREVTLLRGADT